MAEIAGSNPAEPIVVIYSNERRCHDLASILAGFDISVSKRLIAPFSRCISNKGSIFRFGLKVREERRLEMITSTLVHKG